MFGTLRYALAFMVVVTHFVPSYMRWPGYYAVYGFYVLSGFLMTTVLNERYGFSAEGIKRYLSNRVLRIFPPYWSVLTLSLFAAYLLPDISRDMNPLIKVPENLADWLANVFIFGQYFDLSLESARLVPPAWSLHVELFFYLAMGLLLSRSFFFTAVWFAVSLAYTLIALFGHWEFHERYYAIMAGSLGFSLGSLLYFIKGYIRLPKWLLIPVSAAFVLNVLLADRLWRYVMVEGFYLSVFLSALLILALSGLRADRAPAWFKKTDTFLGNLSYPLFLSHWAVAILVAWIGFSGERPSQATLFIYSLPFIHAAAYLIYLSIESRVELIRGKIRGAPAMRKREEREYSTLVPIKPGD